MITRRGIRRNSLGVFTTPRIIGYNPPQERFPVEVRGEIVYVSAGQRINHGKYWRRRERRAK